MVPFHLILGRVILRDQPAFLLHEGYKLIADFTVIECVRSLSGKAL